MGSPFPYEPCDAQYPQQPDHGAAALDLLIIIAGGVAGMMVGGISGRSVTAMGFFVGIVVSLLLIRLRRLSARVAELESQRGRSMDAASHTAAPAAAQRPVVMEAKPVPAAAMPAASIATQAAEPDVAASPPSRPATTWKPPERPAKPDPVEKLVLACKRWLTEGNVPAKVGMLVLFAGVAALLKFAADQGWLSMPIELRLTGIALLAMAALAFGWRERSRRRAFGLALQGGALGILLMTVFAALRLYFLLPAGLAFALMLMLVAATSALALKQDALALAVLALLAGFAAPLLTATGGGSHVVLFAFYALFNVAIFAMAWHRSWRVLNVLGFLCTFGIGTTWGVLRYEPALFASVEPFLLLFFAIYLAIPVLEAIRHGSRRGDAVSGTLVFGNPLLAFALQAGLLENQRWPLAISALVLTALYAASGYALRARARVLADAFVMLAVAFGTLAVPLAMSAQSTACVFALEGAALVWLGFRQGQPLQRWSGLALQLLAAGAFGFALFSGISALDKVAVANGSYLSALLIAVAGFASAALYAAHGGNAAIALVIYLWALGWWVGAGWHEVDRFTPSAQHPPILLAFAALTAALAGLAWQRLRAIALPLTAAVALAAGVPFALRYAALELHAWQGLPLAGFVAYGLLGFVALHTARESPRHLGLLHAAWVWTWTVGLTVAANRFALEAGLASGWIAALTVLPLPTAWALTLWQPQVIGVPVANAFVQWRDGLAMSQAAAGAAAFLMMLTQPGDTGPLPFVPLLNPLELIQMALVICAARWLASRTVPTPLAARRFAVAAAVGFAFATSATLRAVHQLGGEAWNSELASSMLAQTSLTIVWSVLGVGAWILGSRRGNRVLWLAGAVLMGIVLAKLLLVDRSHLGSALGILSFIAYGVLCTVVGYFAPAPPRSPSAASSSGFDPA